jgi:Novel STAND NTPase 1
MKRNCDSLVLATRGRHDAFDKLWADIKNWAAGDPTTALARIAETAKHGKVFAGIKSPIKAIKRNIPDRELIEFIRHLVVMPTNFHLADSEYRRQAIGRCRSLLRDGSPAQAEKLWEALVASVRTARLGDGTVELARLIENLARQFDLNDAPNYEASWRALDSGTAAYKRNIDAALPNGFEIDRRAEVDEVSALLGRDKVTALYGESGSGKSALVKATLDNRFSDWRQVWLGPDQLSVTLSDLDRAKLGLANPLAEVLRASSKSNNVLILDSVERLARQVQASARDLVMAITGDATPWHVIIVGQTEAWTEDNSQPDRAAEPPGQIHFA